MTTTATEKPMSIAASIQADQEPRRFRELRETLRVERDGAVCPLCSYRISDTAIRERDYQLSDAGAVIHNTCREIQLICTGRGHLVMERPVPERPAQERAKPELETEMEPEHTPGAFHLNEYEVSMACGGPQEGG